MEKVCSTRLRFTESLGSDWISEVGSSSEWDETDPDEVKELYEESLEEWLDLLTVKQLIRLNYYHDGESINEYEAKGLLEPSIVETTMEEIKKALIEGEISELPTYDYSDLVEARQSHMEYLYESRYD